VLNDGVKKKHKLFFKKKTSELDKSSKYGLNGEIKKNSLKNLPKQKNNNKKQRRMKS
jgi:hypothetical protein